MTIIVVSSHRSMVLWTSFWWGISWFCNHWRWRRHLNTPHIVLNTPRDFLERDGPVHPLLEPTTSKEFFECDAQPFDLLRSNYQPDIWPRSEFYDRDISCHVQVEQKFLKATSRRRIFLSSVAPLLYEVISMPSSPHFVVRHRIHWGWDRIGSCLRGDTIYPSSEHYSIRCVYL